MPLVLENFTNKDTSSGVWKVTEDLSYFENNLILNQCDKEKIKACKHIKRKLEILASRKIMQDLNISETVKYTETGKPEIENGFISFSHSDDLVCLIHSKKYKCAIDIQKYSSKILNIKNRAFSETELSYANKNMEKLCTLWSIKECVFKIVDSKGIDYKRDILVKPTNSNNYYYAEYLKDNKALRYKMNIHEFNNFTLVWCIE